MQVRLSSGALITLCTWVLSALALLIVAGCPGGTPAPAGEEEEAGSSGSARCTVDADCADQLFCNGEERCVDRTCMAGASPCASSPGSACDEERDECVVEKGCGIDEDCRSGDPSVVGSCVDGTCHYSESIPVEGCLVIGGASDRNHVVLDFDTDLTEPCYWVTSTIEVTDGARLFIRPGVTMKFGHGTGLLIQNNGILSAEGTPEAPIIFTGEQGTRGFWNGIWFARTDSVLNKLAWATVEFGGGGQPSSASPANLVLDGSSDEARTRLGIASCTFRDSAAYGFAADGEGSITIDGFVNNTFTANALGPVVVSADNVGKLGADNSYRGNDDDVLAIRSPTWASWVDQTWRKLGVDYLLESPITIGGRLKIDPGVTVRCGFGSYLLISETGALTAVGSANDRIVFTGDDSEPGFWKGLIFESPSPLNELRFVTVEHGGDPLPDVLSFPFRSIDQANITVAGSVEIRDTTVTQSAGWGILVYRSGNINRDVLRTNTFANNELGRAELVTGEGECEGATPNGVLGPGESCDDGNDANPFDGCHRCTAIDR